MEQAVLAMVEQYQCKTDDDYDNALKQIMQQIALLGLWRTKFFEHAAFYGGTAMRILYKLDRFSEDLDFSLLQKNTGFKLEQYLTSIQHELSSFGFETDISMKEKNIDTAVQSEFLKANTQQHMISIKAPEAIIQRCHGRSLLNIKLEVDTDPPLNFTTETKAILRPIPFWVRTLTLPDLFAGKISAVLCRQWKSRVKGRDWYDLLWFIQNNIPVNLNHLKTRLDQFGFDSTAVPLTQDMLIQYLSKKINELDVDMAKNDIERFIKDPSALEGWSKRLFLAALNELKFME